MLICPLTKQSKNGKINSIFFSAQPDSFVCLPPSAFFCFFFFSSSFFHSVSLQFYGIFVIFEFGDIRNDTSMIQYKRERFVYVIVLWMLMNIFLLVKLCVRHKRIFEYVLYIYPEFEIPKVNSTYIVSVAWFVFCIRKYFIRKRLITKYNDLLGARLSRRRTTNTRFDARNTHLSLPLFLSYSIMLYNYVKPNYIQ